jgi:hypothetical protein
MKTGSPVPFQAFYGIKTHFLIQEIRTWPFSRRLKYKELNQSFSSNHSFAFSGIFLSPSNSGKYRSFQTTIRSGLTDAPFSRISIYII